MWVLVSRTSRWSDEQPVENCEPVLVVREQTFKPTQKPHQFEQWGFNHKTLEDGSLYREFHYNLWKTQIESVEQFVKEHGTCVVSYDTSAQMLSLEIYDDYRE